MESYKGRLYTYALKSASPAEVAAVGDTFQAAGWIEIDFLPKSGPPTHIIFEWQLDRPPVYPSVDWP